MNFFEQLYRESKANMNVAETASARSPPRKLFRIFFWNFFWNFFWFFCRFWGLLVRIPLMSTIFLKIFLHVFCWFWKVILELLLINMWFWNIFEVLRDAGSNPFDYRILENFLVVFFWFRMLIFVHCWSFRMLIFPQKKISTCCRRFCILRYEVTVDSFQNHTETCCLCFYSILITKRSNPLQLVIDW